MSAILLLQGHRLYQEDNPHLQPDINETVSVEELVDGKWVDVSNNWLLNRGN